MGKTAIIFPGQGSQAVGMGRDVADASPAAREVFDRAETVLGFALAKICFEGPAERLEQTDIQQPAIFVTSVALWRARPECHGEGLFQAQAMAGLSLGEYTALHVAGAIEFDDALRLVYQRGRLMQQAAEAEPGGMVSLIGLRPDQVEALCAEARTAGIIGPANFNCPGQVVISGARAACEAAVQIAERMGGRGIPLRVAGAFHSALMRPAAEGLGPVLAETTFRPPQIPVVANVDAEYHTTPDRMRDSLYRQVISPVQWQGSMERLLGEGFHSFVEVGPGRVLTGLMRKIDRRVRAISVSTAEGLAATAAAR